MNIIKSKTLIIIKKIIKKVSLLNFNIYIKIKLNIDSSNYIILKIFI